MSKARENQRMVGLRKEDALIFRKLAADAGVPFAEYMSRVASMIVQSSTLTNDPRLREGKEDLQAAQAFLNNLANNPDLAEELFKKVEMLESNTRPTLNLIDLARATRYEGNESYEETPEDKAFIARMEQIKKHGDAIAEKMGAGDRPSQSASDEEWDKWYDRRQDAISAYYDEALILKLKKWSLKHHLEVPERGTPEFNAWLEKASIGRIDGKRRMSSLYRKMKAQNE